MKFQFTYGDYKEFESDLIIMGFKKYNGKLHSEDYYLAKTVKDNIDYITSWTLPKNITKVNKKG
jgi:hypothetical protein